MYAVFATGGKQYRAAVGDVVRVEKLPGDPGGTFTFDRVLMIGDDASHKIGRPELKGASVVAEILRQDKARKIIVFKFRHRCRSSQRKYGHRQPFTELRISGING